MLSVDIGYKHMVLAYQEKENSMYQIAVFDVNPNQNFEKKLICFNKHLTAILSIIGDIDVVIIEQQLSVATENMEIQAMIGMFFVCQGLRVVQQHGGVKYKNFKCDKKNNKVQSVINLQQNHLNQIKIIYKGQQDRPIINHRFLSQDMKLFLKDNGIDKADDIGDVVLMIQAYRAINHQQ